MEYRQGSHTKYKIEYHFVWGTKYRYAILVGDLATRVRDLVRQTCERYEIQILRGVIIRNCNQGGTQENRSTHGLRALRWMHGVILKADRN